MLNVLVNVHATSNVQTAVHVQFSKISPISVQQLNLFHPSVLKIGPLKSQNATTTATTPTTNVSEAAVTPIFHNAMMNAQ